VALSAELHRWTKRSGAPGLLAVVAGLSFLAAAIHLLVAPEHFSHSLAVGVFFIAIGVVQALWSVAVLAGRATRSWLSAGVAGNIGLALLWAVTRTSGLPMGPTRGEVEPVGLLDVVATTAELGIVVVCAVLAGAGYRATRLRAGARTNAIGSPSR
jgi:hypothetical protein